jgi:hypothetical protein
MADKERMSVNDESDNLIAESLNLNIEEVS